MSYTRARSIIVRLTRLQNKDNFVLLHNPENNCKPYIVCHYYHIDKDEWDSSGEYFSDEEQAKAYYDEQIKRFA